MKSQKLKSATEQSARADLSSLFGLLVAVVCIVGGLVWEGGKVADLTQGTAALIVLGGTLGAMLVTTPFEILRAAVRRFPEVFMIRSQPFTATLNDLLTFAESARRKGLASLENCSSQIEDPFLIKALELAADGTDIPLMREIMLIDLDAEQEHADAEIKVWENAAGYAPTIGIIGAVLGLIQVMKHLENLDDVGRGIAVSFVATVYGVAAANLLFLPVAAKLRTRSREVERLREMMLEGVLTIADGINPGLIRIKLTPFLQSGRESAVSQIAQPLERSHGPVIATGRRSLVSE